MSKGKLIVFEGIDGSGKSTQYRLLCEELERRGVPFRRLFFPQYEEESSALIRMYLRGEFGSKPGDVNAFAASAFFAVDRYASYKKDWGAWFESGGLIVTDRYTTSNAVHQASKLPEEEREPFFRGRKDFEFDKIWLAMTAGPAAVSSDDLQTWPTGKSITVRLFRKNGATQTATEDQTFELLYTISDSGTPIRPTSGTYAGAGRDEDSDVVTDL